MCTSSSFLGIPLAGLTGLETVLAALEELDEEVVVNSTDCCCCSGVTTDGIMLQEGGRDDLEDESSITDAI